MKILLIRDSSEPDGTFGKFKVFDGTGVLLLSLVSMEDDWLNNAVGKSCIPAGTYKLQRTIYYRHGYETFEVMNVPGRTRILIHPANTEEDVEGCIGIGLRYGKLLVKKDEDTGEVNVMKKAVVASKEAFNTFMRTMSEIDEATIEVSWVQGLPK